LISKSLRNVTTSVAHENISASPVSVASNDISGTFRDGPVRSAGF
jgi:hypothetical protein